MIIHVLLNLYQCQKFRIILKSKEVINISKLECVTTKKKKTFKIEETRERKPATPCYFAYPPSPPTPKPDERFIQAIKDEQTPQRPERDRDPAMIVKLLDMKYSP